MVMKAYTFRIEPELLNALKKWSRITGDNVSVIIRKAIQFYLIELSKKYGRVVVD